MERLSTSLQNYHINALQAIAERLGLQLHETPVRKARLVGELTRMIPQIARSRPFVRALSSAEQAALAVVLSKNSDEGTTFREVAQPLMLAELVRTGNGTDSDRPTVQTVLMQLLHKGLLVSLSDLNGASALRTFEYVQVFGIPPEVRSALPSDLLAMPTPASEATRLEHLPQLEAQQNDLRHTMRLLFFAWSELRRQPARQLKAGGIGKRDRRRIAEALSMDPEADLDTVSRLYEMLTALRLVTSDGDAITAVEGDAVILFWNARPSGQLASLLRAYTQLAADFPGDPTVGHISGYLEGVSLQPHDEIRGQVVDILSQVAPMGWIPTELFHRLLCGGRPGSFALGDTWLGYLYRSLHWYGSTYRKDLESALQKTDWQLVHAALNELYAIGLVAFGYPATTEGGSRTEDPVAIRATVVMRDYAYATNQPSHSSAEAPWQVILQPDFQMLAMGPVPLRVLANLELFAHREKIDESVITYRITRDEAYEAFQRGETVASIQGYLTEATDQPIPQNVIRSLEEWYARYERIVLQREVCLFQVDGPALLERLLADPVLDQCLHRVNDTIAWLRPSDKETVEAKLRTMEILPAHSRGPAADLQNSLRWHEQELETISPVPSLYVTGSLHRFAERHNGRWRLTPESTQQATDLGLDVPTIKSMIEEMTGTQLPDPWEKHLKAWGGYFGDGNVGDIRLLRLDREDALEELRRADPQLHRWLRPLPGAPHLAAVNEAHWDDARELLDSWGIHLTTERWW